MPLLTSLFSPVVLLLLYSSVISNNVLCLPSSCQIVVSSREAADECRPGGRDNQSAALFTCGTLSSAFVEAQKFSVISLELKDTFYSLSANDSITTFKDLSSFHISGADITNHITIECSMQNTMTGLTFYNSSNISFINLTLRGCGTLHNSSSIDFRRSQYTMSYLQFLVGIYFMFCRNIELRHVSIADSLGTGAVLYSCTGDVTIDSSNFTNNTAVQQFITDPLAGGGGLAIEFLYCIPGDADCTSTRGSWIPLEYQSNSVYTITNCIFESNNGSTGNYTEDTYTVPHWNYNIALGRGGGALVLMKGNATGNKVTIEGCVMRGNGAVWGGGILIEFQDRAFNNSVIVEDCLFENNECVYDSCTYSGTGGGGARVNMAGFDKEIEQNMVLFSNTKFHDNHAYFGGGLSFFTNPEDVITNSVIFEQVEWKRNTARLGSAVDMSVWHLTTGLLLKPIFIDCNFTQNTIQYTNKTGTPHGAGTVYADSISIIFKKENRFMRNIGSAIISQNGAVTFTDSSEAVFDSNTAYYGGAIALYSNAHLLIHEQVQLVFNSNTALLHGGAIYWESVGNHELVSSRNCFIRYHDSFIYPSDWQATLEFHNNSAELTGNAIYGTTLLGCLWGGRPYGDLLDPQQEYDNVFCWAPSATNNRTIWNYIDSNCSADIATAPGYFSLENGTVNCGDPYVFSTIPGTISTLPIAMLDDRLSLVPDNSLVFTSHLIDSNDSSTAQFTAFEDRVLFGNPGDTVHYALSSIRPRIVSTQISLTFNHCPPGFEFDSSSSECSASSFPFVLTRSNLTSSIQRGYWIGIIDDEIVVAQCSYCPFNSNLSLTNYIELPRQISKLEDYFCDGLNREGPLCRKCKGGYAPAVNSEEYKCVECSSDNVKYSWLLYLLTEFVPITIILALVLIFNISVTSGPLNSFVFFAQVISTTFGVDADGLIPYASITKYAENLRQTYISIYGVWNLNFYLSYDWALFCLGPKVTTLHLLALNYTTAAYPLVLLVIIWLMVNLYFSNNRVIGYFVRPLHQLFVRRLNILNFQRSIMDAFATFIVLSYAKFAATSAVLLYPNGLYDSQGRIINFVSKYDGNYLFTSVDYAPYLASSVFVSFFICLLLPVILFLYSLKPFYRLLQKVHFTYLLPGEKANYFLNAFHHCYKDGTTGGYDQRYFASLLFFIKLIIIYSYSYALNWAQQYIIQQFLCTIAILMICVFQPYKKTLYNIVDGCMFSTLAFINTLVLYNRYLDIADLGLSPSSYYIMMILIFSPSLYFLGYVFYSLYQVRSVKMKMQSARRRITSISLMTYTSRRRTTVQGQEDDGFDYGEFIDDVTHEGRFYQQRYHGPLRPDELNRDVGDEHDALVQPIQMSSSTCIDTTEIISFHDDND